MVAFFQAVLYNPLFNAFVALYNIIPDVGIVILILTVIIKLVLYPLTGKSIRAQKALTELQPKLEGIKKKYKNDQQKLAQETMRIYKENKVNPFGSCLPILIQIPIFLALYWVLRAGLGDAADFSVLYSFVADPGSIDPISLGLFDLSGLSIPLALAAGAAQYWQARSLQRKRPPKSAGAGAKDETMMTMMNKQMLYFMPFLTVIIALQLPAGLALYWFLSTLITAIQQHILFREKSDDNTPDGNVVEGKLA